MIGAAVTQALKDAAYAVDWVMDGQTAIDAAEAEAYDLALLDLSLPAIDGLRSLAMPAQRWTRGPRHRCDRTRRH